MYFFFVTALLNSVLQESLHSLGIKAGVGACCVMNPTVVKLALVLPLQLENEKLELQLSRSSLQGNSVKMHKQSHDVTSVL